MSVRPKVWPTSDVTTSYAGLRARAIESLLIEKGYLTEDAVDYVVSAYEHDIGPMRGARARRPRLGRSGVQGAAARERLRGGAGARRRRASSART